MMHMQQVLMSKTCEQKVSHDQSRCNDSRDHNFGLIRFPLYFLMYKEPFADCVALQIHPLIIEKVWQKNLKQCLKER